MPSPAQTAAAATAVGGGALGGYALSRGLSGGSKNKDTTDQKTTTLITKPQTDPKTVVDSDLPTYKLLSFTKSEHLSHLIKPLESSNEDWWKWAYESKYKKHTVNNTLHELFQGLNLAFLLSSDVSNSDQKPLNKACESAYKKVKADYVFDNSHLLKNISDFCTKDDTTFDISEPKSTLHDTLPTSGYSDSVLSVEGNKAKLVVKGNTNNNDLWWSWAFKNLLTTSAKTTANVHFTKVNSAYHDTANNALNIACDEAYKKTYVALTNSNNQLFNDIKRFCTPSKTPDESLSLPVWKEPVSPKLLNDTANNPTSYSSGVASKEDNKSKLVDPKKPDNTTWWNWSFTTRFNVLEESKKKTLPDIFKSVNSGYSSDEITGSGKEQTALNQACNKAYSLVKAEVEKPDTGENQIFKLIKKFCAIGTITGELTPL